MRLIKRQCIAPEMKHGRPSQQRCQSMCAIETEFCWWHLKNYMHLQVKQMEQHDPEGKHSPLLGVFAFMSDMKKEQLGSQGVSTDSGAGVHTRSVHDLSVSTELDGG